MNKESSIILSRKLLISLLALLVWSSISTGVTYLFGGNNMMGIFFIVIGCGLAIITIHGRLINVVQGRKSPKYNWYIIAIVLILVVISEIAGEFSTQQSSGFKLVFEVISIIGLFLLTSNVLYQVFNAVRSNG